MRMVAPSHFYDHALRMSHEHAGAADESSMRRGLDLLLEYEQPLLDFFEVLSIDALWMWDLEAPERSWMSPRFWRLLGYDPADGDMPAMASLVPPDADAAELARFAAYCAAPDGLYDEVSRFVRRDGKSVWLRCRGIGIRDASGRPVRLLGAHYDVTALKQVEAELRLGKAELMDLLAKSAEANAWLEMAEQAGRVGHFRVDPIDRTLIWSNAMYAIYGVTPESYTPDLASAIAFSDPHDRDRVEALMNVAIASGKPFDFSTRLMSDAGNPREINCRGMTRVDSTGTVSMLVGVVADISEQKQLEQALRDANARLEQLVNVDALTGLANRRGFDELLIVEWRRAAREGTPLSIVMVDLDRFKGYNDRYGHQAGDECLRRVASVLADRGRRSADIAARYGGEEMVLLLPATTAAGAEIIARDCRSSIAALGLRHEGNMSCGGVVTASFGVATAMPGDGGEILSETALLGEADRLLYEAKRTGRDKVVTQSSFFNGGALPMPPDEEARLATLARYQATGATRRTQEMDGIARLAATLTGSPIAMVSYITRDTKHLIGNFNVPGTDSMPRDISLCTHTILGDEPMVIGNATHDVRFQDSPVVTGGLCLRYYAGAPIVSQSTGHKLGTLCVVDTVPHEKTGLAERAILTDLAGMVAALMEDSLKGSER